MSNDELIPITVAHLKSIRLHPNLFDQGARIDAIMDAILDIEDQVLKLIREIKQLREGSLT